MCVVSNRQIRFACVIWVKKKKKEIVAQRKKKTTQTCRQNTVGFIMRSVLPFNWNCLNCPHGGGGCVESQMVCYQIVFFQFILLVTGTPVLLLWLSKKKQKCSAEGVKEQKKSRHILFGLLSDWFCSRFYRFVIYILNLCIVDNFLLYLLNFLEKCLNITKGETRVLPFIKYWQRLYVLLFCL